MPATPAMIDYAEVLIEKCGFDINDYELDGMTYQDVSDLIDELKAELGWD